MQVRIPVLPTFLVMPGDYRTKEQIEIDRIKNELEAQRQRQERPAARQSA